MNGIYDQVVALQWVCCVNSQCLRRTPHSLCVFFAQIQREIANFGGDPNRVTVFGDSAGGYSICTLAVAPPVRVRIATTENCVQVIKLVCDPPFIHIPGCWAL